MKTSTAVFCIVGLVVVGLLLGLTPIGKSIWSKLNRPSTLEQHGDSTPLPLQEVKTLKLSEPARKNLHLLSKAAKPQTYWRTIQIPGVITDRPGISDRGVTSPAVGAVVEIHAFPGDTVAPGQKLFTLRLFSEYLQNTQAELFQATKELQLIADNRARIESGVQSGAVSGSRMNELNNQSKRQSTAIQGYRQDLLTRGLSPEQIDGVAQGQFVSTIDVVAPTLKVKSNSASEPGQVHYEVQQLSVELGQQVQAGQLLSTLSDHQQLYIEGSAFKREATLLAAVAENSWPIQAEFSDDDGTKWPDLQQPLTIRHLANTVDAESRTLAFFVPLENQQRHYEKDGQQFTVWRFRPGQRVRLHIPVEEIKDVIVLPSAAVVREGPEAYVFQQNGDLFNRISVNVLYEDRLQVILANDGSIGPGHYLAQGSAAALNRVLKAQAASGMRADIHVHADGTTHAAH